MSEQFRVKKGCIGFTLPDGRKVNTDRRGMVTVPDRYASAVKNSPHTGDGTIVKAAGATFARVAGKECACGAEIFTWQRACRDCGGKDDA